MGQNYKGTNKMKGDESVHLQCSTVTGLDKNQHETEKWGWSTQAHVQGEVT